ncbi:tRNA (guanosine(37)-N1)-methyltransferase TrmD [Candidatus Dojkabacteria bacterium]|uniref:tRNA (guanine-N(1)-)-methyltransferase n=1 Tax=Candidatus Dojkabacteria bacterium TaxID=2099670 RepID=A0A955L1V1_9BACT|nr:tRNA (guanosine(37)-N1)-methyltransferase TrmD [Candidatus Dojkabacteria bacterium]
MKITIISAFPNAFSFLSESINKRAQEKGLLDLKIINLLDFGLGEWKKIDDKPFGGGAGMVLQVEPIYRALKSINAIDNDDVEVILTSARGETWNQKMAENYSISEKEIVIICGHYEGVDQRVIDNFVDIEISIGNFILSGGEPAAMIMVDSITRLLDGVVGNEESIKDETEFLEDHKLIEYPHYTRPEVFITDEGKELKTPDVLLSGHHAEIEKWKNNNRSRINNL